MSGAATTRLATPSTAPPSRWRSMANVWNIVGAILLSGALGVSLWQVTQTEKQLYSDDIAVVRVAHWQLELGYRSALDRMMNDYNAMQDERFKRGEIPKRIKVIQLPVSEKTYGQLISTNLIAHTAPDLVEMGMSKMLAGGYKAEYFVNLSSLTDLPNPYNAPQYLDPSLDAETRQALSLMTWRDTFLDGLVGGFDVDLQGYYHIATAFASSGRLAVNIDLIKAATGSDRLPTTLGELLKICADLRAYGKREGRDIWPIAATRYNTNFWHAWIAPFLGASQAGLDADHDGSINLNEALVAIRDGRWSFSDPAMADLIAAARAMSKEFPNGFTAMDRDAAMFLFTQQQSAFFQLGAWDAETVYRLAEGKFKVAIIKSVLPGPGELWGPKSEVNEAAMRAGAGYGVYKLSPNVDIAIDFLRYWTSHAQNQRFNQDSGWVPCIVGTSLVDSMKAFTPRIEGLYNGVGWLPTWEGEQLQITMEGQMFGVLTGEVDHAALVKKLDAVLVDPNYGTAKIFARLDEKVGDTLRSAERGIALQALLQLVKPDAAATQTNYQAIVSTQCQGLNGQINAAQRACAAAVPTTPAGVKP